MSHAFGARNLFSRVAPRGGGSISHVRPCGGQAPCAPAALLPPRAIAAQVDSCDLLKVFLLPSVKLQISDLRKSRALNSHRAAFRASPMFTTGAFAFVQCWPQASIKPIRRSNRSLRR